MKTFGSIAYILLIVGGLNWGLVGIFNWNLVAAIFGGSVSYAEITVPGRIIYILVGISAVIALITFGTISKLIPSGK